LQQPLFIKDGGIMKTNTKNLLNLRSEVLCLSLALLATACSPATFNGADSVSSQASGQLQNQSTVGSPQTQTPVAVTPNKSSVPLVDSSEFGVTKVSVPTCQNITQDPLAFNIVSTGAYPVLQITQIAPADQEFAGVMVNMDSYVVYSLFQGDDGLIAVSEYSEVLIDNTRVYGHYNCGFQNFTVANAADKLGIKWQDVASHMKVSVKLSSASAKLVGFAMVNSHTNQATMRCL